MVSDLFFPNPSGRSGSIPFHPPPLASTSTSSSTAKVPPRNFVNQKDFARKLRAPKSPFLPKKRVSLSGEVTEGIEKLGRKEVISMLEKNEQLLIDRNLLNSLPGGDTLIKSRQIQLSNRLIELDALAALGHDLSATHLSERTGEEMELGEGEGEGVIENEAVSPRIKRILSTSTATKSPHSLTTSISLVESMALARKDVERDRMTLALKERMEEAKERANTGGLLRKALNQSGAGAIGEFMFNQDSDSESENGDNVEDDLAQHNEVEEEQLNPYREAFESGYNRAEDEGDMKASERRRADEVDG